MLKHSQAQGTKKQENQRPFEAKIVQTMHILVGPTSWWSSNPNAPNPMQNHQRASQEPTLKILELKRRSDPLSLFSLQMHPTSFQAVMACVPTQEWHVAPKFYKIKSNKMPKMHDRCLQSKIETWHLCGPFLHDPFTFFSYFLAVKKVVTPCSTSWVCLKPPATPILTTCVFAMTTEGTYDPTLQKLVLTAESGEKHGDLMPNSPLSLPSL